jgi:hypothetical protein
VELQGLFVAPLCSSLSGAFWQLLTVTTPLMQHDQERPALTVTDTGVLDCLAAYVVKNEPEIAQALHCTCRAAAAAVQDAMTSISVRGRHADLAHTAFAFPGLTSLKYTQCAVLVEV